MTSLLDTRGTVGGRSRTLVLAVSAALLAIAAAYMARTVWVSGPSKDFAYFWIAGQIWQEGGNPYAPTFSETANAIAAANPEMGGLGGFHRWLYAPHIWGIAAGLAQMGYETARLLWGAVSGVLVLAGCWLTLAAVNEPRGRFFPLAWGALAVLAATTQGTAAALATGQPTALTFFAVAALGYGILRERRWAVIMGFLVLTLKPSLALPFVAMALALPALWLPLAVAAVIALVLALPVLLGTAPGTLVSGYLDGLAAYGQYPANAADAATGLRNLAHHVLGLDIPGMVLILLGALAAMAITRLDRAGRGPEAPALSAPGFAAILAVTLMFVPLHTYELTLALVLLVLAGRGSGVVVALVVAFLVLFRPARVSAILGLVEGGTRFPGSLLSSLMLVALALLVLGVFFAARRRRAGG